MKLLALVTNEKTIARYLAKTGEPTGVPGRSPNPAGPRTGRAPCSGATRSASSRSQSSELGGERGRTRRAGADPSVATEFHHRGLPSHAMGPPVMPVRCPRDVRSPGLHARKETCFTYAHAPLPRGGPQGIPSEIREDACQIDSALIVYCFIASSAAPLSVREPSGSSIVLGHR